MFILFSNGIGADDDEIRTGNSMISTHTGAAWPKTNEPADGSSLPIWTWI